MSDDMLPPGPAPIDGEPDEVDAWRAEADRWDDTVAADPMDAHDPVADLAAREAAGLPTWPTVDVLTGPLYLQIGRMPYDTAGTMVDEASFWNQVRLEPLRSQIVPAVQADKLMPVDAYPAVLVTDQYRADGHVVRTWWTRADQPPPTGTDEPPGW